jgi:hypothetical protein
MSLGVALLSGVVIGSDFDLEASHPLLEYVNGECRERRVSYTTVKECYNATTRKWEHKSTTPDCRERRLGYATVKECYNINTKKWDIVSSNPDCREVRRGYVTDKECYNVYTY